MKHSRQRGREQPESIHLPPEAGQMDSRPAQPRVPGVRAATHRAGRVPARGRDGHVRDSIPKLTLPEHGRPACQTEQPGRISDTAWHSHARLQYASAGARGTGSLPRGDRFAEMRMPPCPEWTDHAATPVVVRRETETGSLARPPTHGVSGRFSAFPLTSRWM